MSCAGPPVALWSSPTDVPDVGLASDDDCGEQFVAEVTHTSKQLKQLTRVVASLFRVPVPFLSPSQIVGHAKVESLRVVW